MANSSDGKNKVCMCLAHGRGLIRRDSKLRQRMKDGDKVKIENKDQIMKGFECHA